jgi:ElaA protein
MIWNIKKFNELDTNILYSILKLRSEVFVLEQKCAYLDIDEKDKKAIHIFSLDKINSCIAYGRIFKASDYYKNYTAITRIVIRKKDREKKLGYELVKKLIEICLEKFPKIKIKISAQKYLQKFYEKSGFVFKGENYLEDGIPHCAMYYS